MRHCLSKLSRSGPFVQVLHQRIRGGGGSNTSLISLMQGGWGVQNVEKPADVILERSLSELVDNLKVKSKYKCQVEGKLIKLKACKRCLKTKVSVIP